MDPLRLGHDLAERADDADLVRRDARVLQDSEYLAESVTLGRDPVTLRDTGPDVIPGITTVERLSLRRAERP
jgi:hypothetical protein